VVIPFERTLVVERSPEEVFDYLSNPANDVDWRESTMEADWVTDPPPGIGSRFKSVDKFLGRRFQYTSEITRWDRPHAYGAKTLDGTARVEFTAELTPLDSGTSLSLHGQARFVGILGYFERFVAKQFHKQLDLEWETLKEILESKPPESRDRQSPAGSDESRVAPTGRAVDLLLYGSGFRSVSIKR
jgi:hypothetical protein